MTVRTIEKPAEMAPGARLFVAFKRSKIICAKNENFFFTFATILTTLTSKIVIQLCDYLGKWLYLAGSRGHFLLPFEEPTIEKYLVGRTCLPSQPACYNLASGVRELSGAFPSSLGPRFS